jgi:sugar lactone lactonase YvrE
MKHFLKPIFLGILLTALMPGVSSAASHQEGQPVAVGEEQTPPCTITTVAGGGQKGFNDIAGSLGGVAAAELSLREPRTVAVDPHNIFYVADDASENRDGGVVYRVEDGKVSIFLGLYLTSGINPLNIIIEGMAFDSDGNFYWADFSHDLIKKEAVTGMYRETIITDAIKAPLGVAVSGKNLYVTSIGSGGDSSQVWKVDLKDPRSSPALIAGGDAHLNAPSAVAFVTPAGCGNGVIDPDETCDDGGNRLNGGGCDNDCGGGNLYIADMNNNLIQKISIPDGKITTYVGQLSRPEGVAVDSHGNLYIADTGNHRVLMADAAGHVLPFAGTAVEGYTGDGRPAQQAQLARPAGVAVDHVGNVYITDLGDQAAGISPSVRRVSSCPVPRTIIGGPIAPLADQAMVPAGALSDTTTVLAVRQQPPRRTITGIWGRFIQARLGASFIPSSVAVGVIDCPPGYVESPESEGRCPQKLSDSDVDREAEDLMKSSQCSDAFKALNDYWVANNWDQLPADYNLPDLRRAAAVAPVIAHCLCGVDPYKNRLDDYILRKISSPPLLELFQSLHACYHDLVKSEYKFESASYCRLSNPQSQTHPACPDPQAKCQDVPYSRDVCCAVYKKPFEATHQRSPDLQ